MSINSPYREMESEPDPRLFLPSGQYVRLDKVLHAWWKTDESGNPELKFVLEGTKGSWYLDETDGKALLAAMRMWAEGTKL